MSTKKAGTESAGPQALAGDDLLTERRLAEIRKTILGETPEPGTEEVLVGEKLDPETLAIACRTVPMLGRRLVVVRHADRLSDECLGVLEDALDTLPKAVAVVLLGSSLDRRRKLFAELERRGRFEALALGGDARKGGLPPGELLDQLLREHGVSMDAAARQRLLEHVGPNGGRLDSEIEKLALAFPDGTVTAAGVADVVAGERSRVAFALEGALRERKLGRAVLELRRAAGAGDAPELLLGQVAGEVRALLRARSLLDDGMSEPEARRAFGSGRGWFAVPAARHYRREDLERLLLELARIDAGSKVGLGDAIAEMESALVDLGRSAAAARQARR